MGLVAVGGTGLVMLPSRAVAVPLLDGNVALRPAAAFTRVYRVVYIPVLRISNDMPLDDGRYSTGVRNFGAMS